MFRKSLMATMFIVVICALSLVLMSCGSDSTGPSGGGGGTATHPSSQFGSFPVPSIANVGGVFGVVDLPIVVSGFTVDSKIAFGGFYNGGSNLVYGGDVKIGSTSMDTTQSSTNVLYLLPGKHVTTQPAVTFDGATAATFTIAGGVNAVPAFSASVTPPAPSTVNAPSANATLSHSSALNVTWTPATGGDTMLVIVTDAHGHTATKSGVVCSAGSVTFSTSDLASFSGSGLVMVAKYRYVVVPQSGKNYAFVGETVSFINVTWN